MRGVPDKISFSWQLSLNPIRAMANFRPILLALAVSVLLMSQMAEACRCAQGVDVCTCQQRELVRPRPLPAVAVRGPRRVCHYVRDSCQFNPIGDVCSCNSQVVRPAARCSSCRPSLPALDNSQNCNHGFNNDLRLYAEEAAPEQSEIPIDAVSFDLVKRMHRQFRNKVPEKHIQYGPVHHPKDSPNTKSYRDIPEHSLYAIDKTIYELKRPVVKQSMAMEDSSEESGCHRIPRIGGYKDFGYNDAVFEEKNFRIKPLPMVDDTSDCNKPKPKAGCGCGSTAGNADNSNFWNYISSSQFLSGLGTYSYSS